MKEKKLKIKDLVTIGVFAVIYVVIIFALGMIGFLPVLYLVYPALLGIVSGTVIMLFMAKVQKPWAVLILGMLSFAIFNTWICGSLMQMLWAREKYIEIAMVMGEDYVNALIKLVTYPNMALVYLGAILGGLIGANIGRILLKKHFIKAGII
ncbi:bacterial integral membrane domain protein [Lachnoanaerobaculum sp. ICM7]|jgi:putative membrane protein|uniref:MptD family putative ECF transporter S component n=1 Tax=Lachnoanaerobaculum sp. ICM7 TaxID=936594 RepID=UPI00027A4F40|nr:MptD family putative ECF transporter S component [Lachnoanaerobaculum sp. ICM7]EJP19407.1 bacterial integral membrane domain protein [Lachnoanaerobaculum sp. ICM7]